MVMIMTPGQSVTAPLQLFPCRINQSIADGGDGGDPSLYKSDSSCKFISLLYIHCVLQWCDGHCHRRSHHKLPDPKDRTHSIKIILPIMKKATYISNVDAPFPELLSSNCVTHARPSQDRMTSPGVEVRSGRVRYLGDLIRVNL